MLKLSTYSILLILLASFSYGQIIFQEDFDNISGPTAGGAGTYNFPSGWLLRNVDNRTPDFTVSYVNEAWERREDFSTNVMDSAAFSTSWYSPTGTADDWMWTPEITLPATGNHLLSWRAITYDAEFQDGYEVRIMVSPDSPTGGTGVLGNQVTNSTLLFNIAAENSSWTNREISLNNYNGQTFRIAFRNNSNDKFLLLIDDIIVRGLYPYNLTLIEPHVNEYTMIPVSQATEIPLGVTVKNNGTEVQTNFNLKAGIYNSSNQLVETVYSAQIESLSADATATPEFPTWHASESDTYQIVYEINTAETDPILEDNIITSTIEISENTYARDNGDIVASLGIGAENGGYLGQSFTINSETHAQSATISYARGYTGRDYKLALWNTDPSGEPVSIIAETVTKQYLNDGAFMDTLEFEEGYVNLSPGRYVLTAVEIDSTIAVAQTSKQFTMGTTFVDWPTNPMGGWANNESFGTQYNRSYAIRLNLGIPPDIITPTNNILYVNQNVSGGDTTGSSWENALPEFADALKWAKENEIQWTAENPLQIWVAQGTYKPIYSPDDNNFGNPDGRNNTFLMVKNVQLFGGFAGNETTPETRDWNSNETILSGDIDNTPDDNSGNAYHVVVSSGEVETAILSGFKIRDANGQNSSSVLVVNSHSIFSANGGGIHVRNSSPILEQLSISNNRSGAGGGIFSVGSSPSVFNTGIYENFADYGGGIGNESSSLSLVNTVIFNNTAFSFGGGMDNFTSSASIHNSIIYGNVSDSNPNIYKSDDDISTFQNSLIGGSGGSGNWNNGIGQDLGGNIDADPLFVDADNGDFSLQACSPAVNSGNNALFEVLNETTLDLAGNPRLYGETIDMGAYEYQNEQIDYSEVVFEDKTVTYDGNAHSIEIENLPEGINVSYEITNENNTTTSGNSATEAGIYQIKARLSGCGETQEFTATLIIEKAQTIITADAIQTFTYDGNMHLVFATLNHVETALSYDPQQGYTNAGTYDISVSAEETDNYLSASKGVTLIIENADWNPGGGGSGVTLPDETYTYNGIEQSIEVENLPSDANINYTITDFENNIEAGNSATNAGVYTVTAELTRPNYNNLILTATLTINKAEAIITANEVQTHTYDGTVKNAVGSLSHNETTLQYSPQQGYTNSGTYPIEISAVETQNYLSTSKEINLSIENADFEGIEFEDGEFTYDGMAHSIFVSNAPEQATVTYTNNAQTNAGTYAVSALIQMPNFNALELTAELIINKAEAIITANEVQTHTYDGTVKNAVGSLNHIETNLVYSPQQGYIESGTYPITISAAETQNYLAVSKEINLIIENAEFEGIEFEDGEFTYDGIAHSIFISNTPEQATVTYTNNVQTNAGTYTVMALIQMPNFNDLELTAELIINKADEFITFNPIPVKHLENDDDFQLDAFASSGLEVYYTFTFETENPAANVTPSGWVELLTSGSIWITAHQDGNENYNPAISVERELEIISSDNSIISINIHGETIENPDSEIYYLIDCDDNSTSVNIDIETETGATVNPGHNFTIEIPQPEIYYQTITVTSQNGIVRTYEIIIEKRFNFNEIVIQKFDNVLLVNNNPDNNGGYEFDAYQWFKNGTLIGTGQYYSAGDSSIDTLDPDSLYHVRMRTADGEWLSTCQGQIEMRAAYSVKIAPNPVYSGNVIQVWVDFPEEELKNMHIKLYSMAGELILSQHSNQPMTEIRLPANMTSATYVIQVNTGKTVKNVQFLVK